MATFNQRTNPTRPVRTTTYEGGKAYQPSAIIDLAFTAACTFVGQDTFYETAQGRSDRIVALTVSATRQDPDAVASLVKRLRIDFKIRAASILVAATYVRTLKDRGSAHRVREVVNSACQRADEPAEFLAYWLDNVGRQIPRGVKLGLGDAVRRLYNEKSVMKYDSKDRAVRMADVIEMCHVKPDTPEQSTLYRYMLDLRHKGKDAWEIDTAVEERMRYRDVENEWQFTPGSLTAFKNRRVLMEIPNAERRHALRTWGYRFLEDSGFTWEMLSSWLPGGMDAEAWSFVIPRMGVMALIRNLRNFDQAELSEKMVDQVIFKITSADDVAHSRIFPYQVLSAYKNTESDNWQRALNKTLDLSSQNVPVMDRTLFLIDTSGSMQYALGNKSQMTRVEVAALQAVTVARQSINSDIAIYGQTYQFIHPSDWNHKSVLRGVSLISSLVGAVGHATMGHSAIRGLFDPTRHNRVVIFTDDQQQDSGHVSISHVPEVITFNIGGYSAKSTWGHSGGQLNIQVAGFSDEVFRVVSELLEMERKP